MKSIKDIVDKHLCCGCGACSYVYGNEMKDKTQYGKRPISDNNNNSDDQQLEFCPGYQSDRGFLIKSPNQTKKSFKEWGPVFGVFTGYAVDDDLRFNASSGGVVTALSVFMINSGRVEGVLQTAADNEKPYLNKTVYNTEVEDVINSSGSRYSPSSPCEGLGHFEDHNKSVVIGKPCDINAVTMLCSKNEELKKKIALKLSIFCAGVPSTAGTLTLLREMGVDELDDIKSLRYRGHGWPGEADAISKTWGKSYKKIDYATSWGKILVRFKQWRCKLCVDRTGQFADISIGDSWNIIPLDNNAGNSLIICRSQMGLEIVKAAVKAGVIIVEQRTTKEISISQKNLLSAKGEVWGRLNALKIAQVNRTLVKGYNLFYLWLVHTSFRSKISSFYGTFRRIKKYNLRKSETEITDVE